MNNYNFLQRYADSLLEKSNSVTNLGLWDGKMGIAITLFHIARIIKNNLYGQKASSLIDTVYENVSPQMPFSFDVGLLGISCGLQYIMDECFMEGDSDEILSRTDARIKDIIDSRTLESLSLETGICGVGFYLHQRLKNRSEDNDNIILLKLKEYLIYLIDWIEELLLKIEEKQNYNDVYLLLCRLQKLNVFNHKMEKLITFCLQRITEHNCRIQDNYELLGINSLKFLKPWM
jgi:hypothetical protein